MANDPATGKDETATEVDELLAVQQYVDDASNASEKEEPGEPKGWENHPMDEDITIAQVKQTKKKLPQDFLEKATDTDLRVLIAEYKQRRRIPIKDSDSGALMAELSRRSHAQADRTQAMEASRAAKTKNRRRAEMPTDGAPVPVREQDDYAHDHDDVYDDEQQELDDHEVEALYESAPSQNPFLKDPTHESGLHHGGLSKGPIYADGKKIAKTSRTKPTLHKKPFTLYGQASNLGPSAGTRQSAARLAAHLRAQEGSMVHSLNPLAQLSQLAHSGNVSLNLLAAHADLEAKAKILKFEDDFTAHSATTGQNYFPANQFLADCIKESYSKYVGQLTNKIVTLAAAESITIRPSTALTAKMIHPNFEYMPLLGMVEILKHIVRRNEKWFWGGMCGNDPDEMYKIKAGAYTNLICALSDLIAFCMMYPLSTQMAGLDAMGRAAVMNNVYMEVLDTCQTVLAEVTSRPEHSKMRQGFSAGSEEYRRMFPGMKQSTNRASSKKRRRVASPRKRYPNRGRGRGRGSYNNRGGRGGFYSARNNTREQPRMAGASNNGPTNTGASSSNEHGQGASRGRGRGSM